MQRTLMNAMLKQGAMRCTAASLIRAAPLVRTAAYRPATVSTARHMHATPAMRAPSDVPASLAKDLHDIIHNDRLVMFLTGTPEEPRCRFTMQVVDLMDQLGVKYGFFNIMDDDEVCEGLKRYSDWPTYPQVYIDGELLGGYDICKQMMLDGSLVKLFKEKELL